jgi:hypothetical protein
MGTFGVADGEIIPNLIRHVGEDRLFTITGGIRLVPTRHAQAFIPAFTILFKKKKFANISVNEDYSMCIRYKNEDID